MYTFQFFLISLLVPPHSSSKSENLFATKHQRNNEQFNSQRKLKIFSKTAKINDSENNSLSPFSKTYKCR